MQSTRERGSAPGKRPLSLTILSFVFIATGLVGLLYHARELNLAAPFNDDTLLVLLIRVAALVSGIYMFRGSNWARWLAVFWIGYHAILSSLHSTGDFVTHALLLTLFTFLLFRPAAARYFARPPLRVSIAD